jgi:small subunit ribosomal protein S6
VFRLVRSYELVFIIHPQVEGDALTALLENVKGLIERNGGKVVHVDPWGVRRLAYPIRKQWEGQYVLMRLELEARGVAALERDLRLLEPVLRYLVVRVEEEQVAVSPEPAAA